MSTVRIALRAGRPDPYRLTIYALLALALVAALVVAFKREQREAHSRRVEIVMDASDLYALSRSYNYQPEAFLVALRRAGLTSLAVAEELGSAVSNNGNAFALSGGQLIMQARSGSITDPMLASLVRSGKAAANEVYLSVYDAATFKRYLWALGVHLGPSSVRVLHASPPYLIAVRTDPDYFSTVALGLPGDQVATAAKLHLLLVPRIQNDERVKSAGIAAIYREIYRHRPVSTVIFFGLRNQVLGFPDDVQATADGFRSTRLNFGSIEIYDRAQLQKGTEELAKLIPGQTTRVQAVARVEQEKLEPPALIERYLLGARERNVRVLYLRPWLHEWNGLSVYKSNLAIVQELHDRLLAEGFTVGRATPVPAFRTQPLLVALMTLAVPALLLLLLDWYGIRGVAPAVVAIGLDLVFYGGLSAIHHDMLARKALALAGGILFPVAATFVIAPAFSDGRARPLGAAVVAGLRVLGIALLVTLGGALLVVGLLSTPLTMEEIDRFTGVKAVLLVPPLLILLAYLTNARFGTDPARARGVFGAPVQVYQLLVGVAIVGAGYLLLSRSGNQSDIAPSGIELALRAHLTTLLSVRPRFKEFMLGFPLLMLLPSLLRVDTRKVGWLVALGIGVGLADVVDTFSHLHTPLSVSVLRAFNGAAIGALLGIVAIVLYLRLRRDTAASVAPESPATAPTPLGVV